MERRKMTLLELTEQVGILSADPDAPEELRTMTPTDFQRGFYFGVIAAQEALGLHNFKVRL